MTEKEIQHNPETREQFKEQKSNVGKTLKQKGKVRIRLFPIWLRVLLVLIVIIISIVTGIFVGYGVIGDGNPMDALKESTWTHIADLVNKK